MTVKIQIDESKIVGAAERAFKETAFLLGREFTKAISSNIWEWPTGQSPRDIVDDGQLRGSQLLVFLSAFEAEFSWNTDYAFYVNQGYTLANGTEVPGRDWTKYATENFDIPGTAQKLATRYAIS